jgi:dolichol-phosphate mannosyltransferase
MWPERSSEKQMRVRVVSTSVDSVQSGLVWEVPAFRVHSFALRVSRYAVCVFVINEGNRLRSQLARMRAYGESVDIIIADGGSTDGSVAPELLRAEGVNTLLVKQGPGKLSAQMRMAFSFALRRGYEGVIAIDGNDKDDPAAIPEFVRALDEGCDHAQGSRFIIGGRAIHTPWARWWAIRLIHAPLISWAAGFRYTDTTNGFRAYSRRLLLDPSVAPFRAVFARYELHYYLAIRAARLGFNVREIPVTRAYPAEGKIPTKISKVRGNLVVLHTLIKACLRQFDPSERETALRAEEPSDAERPHRPYGLRGQQRRTPTEV